MIDIISGLINKHPGLYLFEVHTKADKILYDQISMIIVSLSNKELIDISISKISNNNILLLEDLDIKHKVGTLQHMNHLKSMLNQMKKIVNNCVSTNSVCLYKTEYPISKPQHILNYLSIFSCRIENNKLYVTKTRLDTYDETTPYDLTQDIRDYKIDKLV